MRLPLRVAWIFIGLILAASPARAFYARAGAKETVGSNGYAGTAAWLKLGHEAWSVKPSYSFYRSDSSSGTYHTFSVRLGHDAEFWGVGMTGGGTPKVNGYRKGFIGIDGSIFLGEDRADRGEDSDGELLSAELGAAWTRTTHSDEFELAAPAKGRGRELTRPRPASVDIAQSDLEAWASASWAKFTATLEISQSFYDKDLDAVSARSAQTQSLRGLDSAIQGFPKSSGGVRLETAFFPVVTPYISYTRTTFKVSQPTSNAYGVGAELEIFSVVFDGAYQRYAQEGEADRNYFTAGARFKF